ncbi:MAG: hypothetical protein ABJB86_14995 [Bacteroidota bacterium]
MRKIIPAILLFLLLHQVACAQNIKHDFIIAAGFSSGDGHSIRPYPPTNGINTPDLNCEYYFSSAFSAGLCGIYYHNTFKWESNTAVNYGYKDSWEGFNAGVKATFHMAKLLKINPRYFDVYVTAFGGSRSLTYWQKGINTVDPYSNILDYKIRSFSAGGISGIRFLCNRKLGFYAELGFSRELFINAGISYNLAKKKTSK